MRASQVAAFYGGPATRSVAWTPARLFADSEPGAWYDPSDLSTVWQDAAATTPGAVGSIVRRIDDKSGNGNHWTAPSDAASPTLRLDEHGIYLERDGVDDVLNTATNFTLQTGWTIAATASYPPGASITAGILALMQGSTNYLFINARQDVERAESSVRGAAASVGITQAQGSSGSYPATAPAVIVGQLTSLSHNVRINGTAIATKATTWDTETVSNALLRFGDFANTASAVPANLYAAVIRHPELTSDELGALETWLAGRASGILSPEPFVDFGSPSPMSGSVTHPAALYASDTDTTWLTWEAGVEVGGVMKRRVYVTPYDHTAGAKGSSLLAGSNTLEDDDHGRPAIARDHEGYLHVFYGAHLNDMHYASTDSPDDHTAWTERTAFSGAFTYPKPCVIGSDMFLFMRGRAGDATEDLANFCVYKTTALSSGVATWDSGQNIIRIANDHRIYVGVTVISGTDIHIIATKAEDSDSKRLHVYYIIYDSTTGSITNHAGTTTVTTANQPIDQTTLDDFRIVDQGTKFGAIPGMCLDSSDVPHVLYLDGDLADGPFDLKHIKSDGAGGWTTAVTVGTVPDRYDPPAVVPLADGVIEVYHSEDDDGNWTRGGNMRRRRREADGTWRDSELFFEANMRPMEDASPVINAHADLRVFIQEIALQVIDTRGGVQRIYASGDSGFVW